MNWKQSQLNRSAVRFQGEGVDDELIAYSPEPPTTRIDELLCGMLYCSLMIFTIPVVIALIAFVYKVAQIALR